jgi:hypothetical protein
VREPKAALWEDSMALRSDRIFVGIKGAVLAIDRETGAEQWRADLQGTDFVNVTLQESDLFAASRGRLYRLDPVTGTILWCNELPGLGWGIMSIAGASQAVPGAAEKKRQDVSSRRRGCGGMRPDARVGASSRMTGTGGVYQPSIDRSAWRLTRSREIVATARARSPRL